MPLEVVLPTLDGKRFDEAVATKAALDRVLPVPEDLSFPMLRFIDPQGSTILNGSQMCGFLPGSPCSYGRRSARRKVPPSRPGNGREVQEGAAHFPPVHWRLNLHEMQRGKVGVPETNRPYQTASRQATMVTSMTHVSRSLCSSSNNSSVYFTEERTP
jgi:hypothetical protein